MKNLLLIHLESLNYINYRLNKNMFPTIYKLESSGMFFERYYSTATSTLMVIGDLLYGGMEQYEQCKSLDDIPEEYIYPSSLFDDLKEQGYYTALYVHPEGGGRISAEKRHIAGFHNAMILKKNYKDFMKALEEGMAHPRFALMACNYISNLSFCKYEDFSNYNWNITSWEIGYRSLDKFVNELIEMLKNKSLLDSTMVVLYGDHGDDYWTHGFHKGLSHAIEPNELLSHVPLLILDSSVEHASASYKLISTTDLREIIYHVIIEDKHIDSVIPDSNIIVSRNEYAAQPIRNESFNKAYSVTDGQYLLMVSSAGLEMYNVWMDSSCHNNLLRYFVFTQDYILESGKMLRELSYHMSDYMSDRTRRIIRHKFYNLWEKLYTNVLALYEAGKVTKDRMENEMDFYNINYGEKESKGI